MKGTAFTFGDDINTDVIMPIGPYTNLADDFDEVSKHIFEPIRPDFTDEIEDGDVIVAGGNFGSGSGRESAPVAIQSSGIAAVVAESFSRIFYRNAIAIGFPVITCQNVTREVSEGDTVEIDLQNSTVTNISTDRELDTEPLPPAIQSLFDMGGWSGFFESGRTDLRLD